MLQRQNKHYNKPIAQSFSIKPLTNTFLKNKPPATPYVNPRRVITTNKPFPLNPFIYKPNNFQFQKKAPPQLPVQDNLNTKKDTMSENCSNRDPTSPFEPPRQLSKSSNMMEIELDTESPKDREKKETKVLEPIIEETHLITDMNDKVNERNEEIGKIEEEGPIEVKEAETVELGRIEGETKESECTIERVKGSFNGCLDNVRSECKKELQECKSADDAFKVIMKRIDWFEETLRNIFESYDKMGVFIKDMDKMFQQQLQTVFKQFGKSEQEQEKKVQETERKNLLNEKNKNLDNAKTTVEEAEKKNILHEKGMSIEATFENMSRADEETEKKHPVGENKNMRASLDNIKKAVETEKKNLLNEKNLNIRSILDNMRKIDEETEKKNIFNEKNINMRISLDNVRKAVEEPETKYPFNGSMNIRTSLDNVKERVVTDKKNLLNEKNLNIKTIFDMRKADEETEKKNPLGENKSIRPSLDNMKKAVEETEKRYPLNEKNLNIRKPFDNVRKAVEETEKKYPFNHNRNIRASLDNVKKAIEEPEKKKLLNQKSLNIRAAFNNVKKIVEETEKKHPLEESKIRTSLDNVKKIFLCGPEATSRIQPNKIPVQKTFMKKEIRPQNLSTKNLEDFGKRMKLWENDVAAASLGASRKYLKGQRGPVLMPRTKVFK